MMPWGGASWWRDHALTYKAVNISVRNELEKKAMRDAELRRRQDERRRMMQ